MESPTRGLTNTMDIFYVYIHESSKGPYQGDCHVYNCTENTQTNLTFDQFIRAFPPPSNVRYPSMWGTPYGHLEHCYKNVKIVDSKTYQKMLM